MKKHIATTLAACITLAPLTQTGAEDVSYNELWWNYVPPDDDLRWRELIVAYNVSQQKCDEGIAHRCDAARLIERCIKKEVSSCWAPWKWTMKDAAEYWTLEAMQRRNDEYAAGVAK